MQRDFYGVAGSWSVVPGNCLDVLKTLPDASMDAVVTDPPYGLSKEPDMAEVMRHWLAGDDYTHTGNGFMGKSWDSFVPGPSVWRECFRVLKPGGHLLSFAGSRTQDLMGLAIRLAGFEIRDSIAWLYGSGFPKSLDVSKAIDKARDDNPDRRALGAWLRKQREIAGLKQKEIAAHWPSATGGLTGCVANWEGGFNCPTWEQWLKLRKLIGFGDEMDAEVWRLNGRKGTPGEAWQTAEVVAVDSRYNEPSGVVNIGQGDRTPVDRQIKAANSEAAQQWQGWGTALKPAFEPIVVARKPLTGTVAANVLEHGTGALNIDACRISTADKPVRPEILRTDNEVFGKGLGVGVQDEPAGRWPTNVVLDESQAAELDQQGGTLTSGKMRGGTTRGNREDWSGPMPEATGSETYGDSGGASRFFPVFRYQAKAPAKERPKDAEGKGHPTVKPLELMRWLVKLVTPPGGIVLEPFAGSGTTIEAAVLEGFRAFGIEREDEYIQLILERMGFDRDSLTG